MRCFGNVFFIFLLISLLCLQVSAAESVTRGFFSGISFSRVKLELPNSGGEQSFRITENTVYLKFGEVVPVDELKKLLPHTRIQVISKDGEALEVMVVEVPR